MALVGNDFYVADTDALLRFPYEEGQTTITAHGIKLADLPAGPINHHWTKNVIAVPTVGISTSRWARTAMSPRTASTQRRGVPRSGR